MNRILAISAAAASVLYLFFGRMLGYPGGAILKTSMCVLLAALAWRHRRNSSLWRCCFQRQAMRFWLSMEQSYFYRRSRVFLITHVLYAALFVRLSKATPFVPTGLRKLIMFLPIAFAVGYSVVLWPNLGALALPVLLYILAIVVMAVLSFRVQVLLVPVGALLFMASDSLIAYEKFIQPAPWLGVAVWVTYALAQQFIVQGVARTR